MCVQKAPSIRQSVFDTLVSEGQNNDEQTPDTGASASIPEPWDDITGNKVSATGIQASRVSQTGVFGGTAEGL